MYDMDSRRLERSGEYLDPSRSPRGPPSMKSIVPDQQLSGWRRPNPSSGAHHFKRKEGPNWIIIAGGAIVTVIGVLIVRKKRPNVADVKVPDKNVVATLKDRGRTQQSGTSFMATRRESTGSRTSELSEESPFSGDPFHSFKPQSLSEGSRVGSDWGDEDAPLSPPAIYYSQFSKGSNRSNRTVITPTSPPGSYRGADTSATECNESFELSPRGWVNLPSRRDIVHHLRQQLKSRDEMILEMQAQIVEHERTIDLHRAHCSELEISLEIANKTLLESGCEVQRLQFALAGYLRGHNSKSEDWEMMDISSLSLHTHESASRGSGLQSSQHDGYFVMREARRLAEELKAQEDEKHKLERLASLKTREHELVVERLKKLEADLEEARESDFGKGLLLEAYEVEHENLEDKVDNLKRLIEINAPDKSSAISMIGRKSLSGSVGLLRLEHQHIDLMEETGITKAKEFTLPGRNVAPSDLTLLERESSMSSSCGKGRFKADESSSTGDASDDSDTEDLKSAFSEKVMLKLQQEVEQLSVILTNHSNMISEKRLETTRLLDEFQRHNALISDIQKKMDENGDRKIGGTDQVWDNQLENLSFASDSTSAFQVQELSHKLEQIEKQQRVEEEIAELSKHQVKIAELKRRVDKLLNKFQNLEDSPGSLDPKSQAQASKMAAVGLELAQQLAIQDEQARRTSIEVQRLSASFQLSSPYVPRSKKEELQKLLQDTRSESVSPPLEIASQDSITVSRLVSLLESRFSTGSEGKPNKNGDTLFDRAISVSSAERATTPSGEGSTRESGEQVEQRSGLSDSSARKLRRALESNLGSGKDQSIGIKRWTSRGMKNGASRDSGKDSMDSSRRVGRSRRHAEPSDEENEQLDIFSRDSEEEVVSISRGNGHVIAGAHDWHKKFSHLDSAPQVVQMDNPWLEPGSPVGRRLSSSFFNSSDVRIGSPTMAACILRNESNTKSSFGRFLFDLENGNEVYDTTQDNFFENDCNFTNIPSLRPTMASSNWKQASFPVQLDWNSNDLTTSSVLAEKGKAIIGSPQQDEDHLKVVSVDEEQPIMSGPRQERGHKSSGSISESTLSIGSSFDALLDDTLDDLLLAFSNPSSPDDAAECQG